MRYATAIVLLIVLVGSFTGCTMNYTAKAKSLAIKHVKQKYGFEAKILDVRLDEPGELEFIWKSPDGAEVIMEHNGVQFVTLVDFKSGAADSYESDKIENEAREYFQQKLDAKKLALRLEFREDKRMPNFATKNVRSFQDVLKSGKCSLAISIYTYGLKEKNVDRIDVKELGGDAIIGISDWGVDDFPTKHTEITATLPHACEDDLVYLNAHYFINKKGEISAQYYNIANVTEDVAIVTPDELDVRIERFYQQPNLSEIKNLSGEKLSQKTITPWHRVHVLNKNYKPGKSKAVIFLKARPKDGNLKPLEGDKKDSYTSYVAEWIEPSRQSQGEFVLISKVMQKPSNQSHHQNRKFFCSSAFYLDRENMFRVAIRE